MLINLFNFMKNIILDTSFILTALKFHIDIKLELKNIIDETFLIFYIDKTLKELENKPLEKLAKGILENMNAKAIKTSSDGNVDSLLIAHSIKNSKDIIATQDKVLKEKLKKRNITLITIRQKKHLKLIK